MNRQNRTNRIKKLAGFTGSLIVLPILAACDPQTLQQPPAESPITSPTPEAAQPPTPTESGTIVDVAAADDSFTTLTSIIRTAGLTETLQGEGPFTVFAPTNEAFEALPAGTLDKLLQPENRETLTQILNYHVVPGEVTSTELQPGEVATVEGNPVNVQVDPATNEVTVSNARVTQPDIQANNGVIHAVDQVLLPPGTTF